jgi:aerobic-type carbon monoxide dehydrogenase small subunit (CoxS/CutS family)
MPITMRLPMLRLASSLTILEGPMSAHPAQKFHIEKQAFQYVHCLNGWVQSAKSLLDADQDTIHERMNAVFVDLACRNGKPSPDGSDRTLCQPA